jgi:hypothetical protein
MYLKAVAERLRGKPFDDADVWRARGWLCVKSS